MSEQAATTAAEPEAPPEMDMPAQAGTHDQASPADTGEEEGGEAETGVKEPAYRSAEFETLENDVEPEGIEPNLDVILNIPVTLSMQIGRTQMTIEELMQLNRGSVVKLDRMAGEPMDVLVNGTLIAHGEVVVVNEKFGIRLLDVISPAERVKKLR